MSLRLCRTVWIAALVCASATSGCATEYSHRHAYKDGWRLATVKQIGGFEMQLNPADDCRCIAFSNQSAGARYAELWFSHHRHPRYKLARLPEGRAISVGDLVYVDIEDCRVPLDPAFADGTAMR